MTFVTVWEWIGIMVGYHEAAPMSGLQAVNKVLGGPDPLVSGGQ